MPGKYLVIDVETGREVELPMPGMDEPFGELVNRYSEAHNTSLAETFRRIADQTGNSPNTLSLRYRNRGGDPWRGSDPDWTYKPREAEQETTSEFFPWHMGLPKDLLAEVAVEQTRRAEAAEKRAAEAEEAVKELERQRQQARERDARYKERKQRKQKPEPTNDLRRKRAKLILLSQDESAPRPERELAREKASQLGERMRSHA